MPGLSGQKLKFERLRLADSYLLYDYHISPLPLIY